MLNQLRAIARACYDWSLYDEVTRQRARRTVGYFTLLVVIAGLIVAATVTVQLRSFVRNEFIPELGKLPVVTIRDHQASANVPQPWEKSFADPNTGLKTIVVIDTTGQKRDFALDEQGFIVTRTQLLMKNPQNPFLQPLNFTDVDDVVIDATLLERWIGLGLKIVAASCAVVLPIYYTAAKLIHALILSLVGLIAASRRRKPLRFGQLFTIAIYALTPAIALDIVRGALFQNFPWFWVIYLGVGGVFTWFGVKHVHDDDPALPSELPKVPIGGPPFQV
jgi:hypothetical protein